MNNGKILVVEDDRAIRHLITISLQTNDYDCIAVDTGVQALEKVISERPDVMILDLGLPDIDGQEVIHRVRSWSSMPIIVVSARTEDSDKIQALDEGADDYLTKPFSANELMARVRVALRRLNPEEANNKENEKIFNNGSLRINYEAGCTYVDGVEIHLTPIEYRLLCLLAQNVGKVLTYNTILKEVWGSAILSETPSLRVFMATLRKKIEKDSTQPQYIQTHVGVGYRMLRIAEK